MSFAIAFSLLSARLCTVRHAGRAGPGGPSSIGGGGGGGGATNPCGSGGWESSRTASKEEEKVNVPVATLASTLLPHRVST